MPKNLPDICSMEARHRKKEKKEEFGGVWQHASPISKGRFTHGPRPVTMRISVREILDIIGQGFYCYQAQPVTRDRRDFWA